MRLFLALSLTVVLWLACASAAAANTYFVYACKTRLGTVAPTDGFVSQQFQTNGYATTNGCATGGPLTMRISGTVSHPAGARATWHYTAPPNTEIRQFDMWRTGEVLGLGTEYGPSAAQFTSFPGADWASDGKEWCASDLCRTRGNESNPLGVENQWYSGQLSGVRDVWFSAGCIGTGTCQPRGSGQPMAEMKLHALQVVLTDEYAPTPGAVSGELVATGAPHRGAESAAFSATDLGSGLLDALVEVKGPSDQQYTVVKRSRIDFNGGRCAELDGFNDTVYEYGYGQPCKLSASTEVEWDTRTKPDGTYQLRIRMEDAAGNVATVSPARSFEIDNVPPPAAETPPRVVGTAMNGNKLLADRGQWNGAGYQYAVQWLRCTDRTALDTCAAIPGAVANDYTLRTDDLGRFVRVRVTATSPEGTGTAQSEAVGKVVNTQGVVPQCADGIDNDADSKVDTDDPGCTSREGVDEAAETIPQGPFTTPTPTPVRTPTPTPSPTSTPAPAGGGATGGSPSPGGASGGSGAPSDDLNGTNASELARLSIAGSARRTLPFGRGALTQVSLRDENGRPISGATVVVLQRMAVPGAPWVPPHAPLTTDSDGRIRYAIEPRFSRTLRFAYRPHRGEGTFVAIRELRITVKSRTSLSTDRSYLRNGQAVTFAGRLASRPVPRHGVVVDLQAAVGRRWQTFQTVRTSEEGRWNAPYRFRSTTGVQTYTFRARVRGDSGFPYAPSISRSVKVRVSG